MELAIIDKKGKATGPSRMSAEHFHAWFKEAHPLEREEDDSDSESSSSESDSSSSDSDTISTSFDESSLEDEEDEDEDDEEDDDEDEVEEDEEDDDNEDEEDVIKRVSSSRKPMKRIKNNATVEIIKTDKKLGSNSSWE